MRGLRSKPNIDWLVVQELGDTPTTASAQLAVLMDIRDELQKPCVRVRQLPRHPPLRRAHCQKYDEAETQEEGPLMTDREQFLAPITAPGIYHDVPMEDYIADALTPEPWRGVR